MFYGLLGETWDAGRGPKDPDGQRWEREAQIEAWGAGAPQGGELHLQDEGSSCTVSWKRNLRSVVAE